MIRSSLFATAATLSALAAAPAVAAPPALSVSVDAGTDAWSPVAARTLTRTVTPPGVDGLQLRTWVDGSLVDTSSAPELAYTFDEGPHLVQVEASAPNFATSPKALARVQIDTVAPEVSIVVPAQTAYEDLPVVGGVYASDPGGSGVRESAMTVDGAPGPFGSWFSLPLAPGPHTVHARAVDLAGNAGEARAATTVLPPAAAPVEPRPAPRTTTTPKPPTSRRRRTSPSTSRPGYALCANLKRGEQCGPGNGRRTKGGPGTGNVSHKGWPAVTGVLWKVLDSGDHQRTGGPDNDELLGHHGDDRLRGVGGHDILWGDWDPKNNNGRQRDVLDGGPGNDWIYPSHGTNRMKGGAGNDHIIAYYGHGTIDCGPGRDIAQVRMNRAYKLRNCEKVKHFT